MPNQVVLSFAGDAANLARESKLAEQALAGVGEAALESARDMERAAGSSGEMLDRMGKLGAATDGASTAIGDAAGALQAFADVQDMARANAVRLERALIDVEQAQADLNQAVGDGKQAQQDATQAGIDYKQAQVDARVALDDYKAAVDEFGEGSAEAAQAQVDLEQANADAAQAILDKDQALRDGQQSLIDARTATADLSDANAAANPGQFQAWADTINTFAPILQGVIGILALVTAAQWLWNTALLANPIVWIVALIVGLIAIIVLIATQTNWFSDLWNAAWDGIKAGAEFAWNFIKKIPGWIGDAFRIVGDAITLPFRLAFNGIANLWNNTIGRLSWTVPDWVPAIGGMTISVPRIPTFHTGGEVQGPPGTEVLAMLQAGEVVTPRGGAGPGGEVRFVGNTSDALATVIMTLVRQGKIQFRAGV